MKKPLNVLVLMSDEHNPKFLGCVGHPFIQTPHLDRLASRGTRFSQAYTCSPICVPARAAFATGRYVHEVGFWDNADAYDGSVPSWHHALRQAGHRATSIGKLHFRGQPGDDHGWSEEILPMHVIDGIGDIKGLVRSNIPMRRGGDKMAKLAGPGESTYTRYDRQIGDAACTWLQERAQQPDDKPWVLFVSMVAPHFPLTAPTPWYEHYAALDLPMPKLYDPAVRPHHPYTDEYARVVDYGSHFHNEQDVRRAIAGYCGLVSFMDEQMGQVLAALDQAGMRDDSLVFYTSDHGVNLGARGLWGKSVRSIRRCADDSGRPGHPGRAGAGRAGQPRGLCRHDPSGGRSAGASAGQRAIADRPGTGGHRAPFGAVGVPRHRLHGWRHPAEARQLQILPLCGSTGPAV